jgi:hypothetical protein
MMGSGRYLNTCWTVSYMQRDSDDEEWTPTQDNQGAIDGGDGSIVDSNIGSLWSVMNETLSGCSRGIRSLPWLEVLRDCSLVDSKCL